MAAEPKIVEALLTALEEVTGKPRRAAHDEHGNYARAVIDQHPVGYWRLNEADGSSARSAVASDLQANLSGGFAWYLPGAGSGTGTGDGEFLKPTAFSGPQQINRAVHVADGRILIDNALKGREFTLSLWFWLGEPSGASLRSGNLCRWPSGARLVAQQDQQHRVTLRWEFGDTTPKATDVPNAAAAEVGYADDWHNVTIVAGGNKCRVFVDGRGDEAESLNVLTIPFDKVAGSGALELGTRLQGKLDEVALFDRALDTNAVRAFWKLSEMELEHKRAQFARARSLAIGSGNPRPLDTKIPATFAAEHRSKSRDCSQPCLKRWTSSRRV